MKYFKSRFEIWSTCWNSSNVNESDKKKMLWYKRQHEFLKFCMLKEFSITTTITVSNSVFIGAVFQFEVIDAFATKKKKVYEAMHSLRYDRQLEFL